MFAQTGSIRNMVHWRPKMQVQAIQSTWPYLLAGDLYALLSEELIIKHTFRYYGFSNSFRRGRSWRRLSPQASRMQQQFDETGVVPLDKPDDSHFSAAVRALKGINLVYALDEHCPGEPAFQLVLKFRKCFSISRLPLNRTLRTYYLLEVM
jgi:hypothetical protein